MTASEISVRIDKLRTAIAYSRYKEKYMSVGEGIACNQEVASWFAVLDGRRTKPKYQVSPEVNEKVLLINQIATRENWQNPSELI